MKSVLTVVPCLSRYLREEGKALVTQATDEQSQQTNAVTYIQVNNNSIVVVSKHQHKALILVAWKFSSMQFYQMMHNEVPNLFIYLFFSLESAWAERPIWQLPQPILLQRQVFQTGNQPHDNTNKG